MSLRSLSISKRLMLGYGVLALLVTSLGLFGLLQLSELRAQGVMIETNAVAGIVESNNLALLVARTRTEVVRLLTTSGTQTLAPIEKKIRELISSTQGGFGRYEKLVSSERERRAFDSLKRLHQDYVSDIDRVISSLASGKLSEAQALVQASMAEIGARMNDEAGVLLTINNEDMQATSRESDATYKHTQTITWTIIGLALTLTVLLAWRLTLSMTRPIAEAVLAARTIASGDLTQTLDTRGHDEAAQLLQAMQQMQTNLRDTLRHLGHSATQLASAAEEMTAVMQESAHGLQQQNSEIEMAATAVTEMSQAVDEVAGNATSTSSESRQAADTARQGQLQLGDTLGAIEVLTENVLGASEQARQLAEQTRDISQVLDVIRSVAEQTNLLALNAAIEAARAGEAGRGFAVVADEVRALAHRTGESTREIEGMIGSIQQGTGQTVDALLTSADQARQTREQAQSANAALAAIAQSVSGIDERNLVIASAAEEQAQVAREVDRNLVRIRDLSVQTAAGAEQTRTASQQLSELAVELNSQLERFRL
ncbi:methyl-accepting chemotaxis protein [Pseudomonas oryzihabitans]|uniref:Methyl-accepting chemotaxis protein n=2 Tax=Pseudomonas oryzihabitans TaxID=47885 RepID=A0A2Z5A7E2_9PSED|nr:methyl-accepting chemotaxis protein [Pseudomonas oryzihabitans]AXA66768.1 methyl-accepting chemotaxis protein [Pseudomonas oryzihabitans]